ncbi:MAG: cyclic lactone autoinducer peptide [Tissierellia bacterium]|nr:cyclic lactone autoinducer peptide [Tissierellia bacterium]MDD3226388.1 cyclic lactone autoinducer peptide [Tissierellia bacterium]MDD4046189.1 cyclic lactone autoinducer peptide [Tissierellia bacterium]
MKKDVSVISRIAMLLEATAQTSMGATCLFWVNQPKAPQCLLEDDK